MRKKQISIEKCDNNLIGDTPLRKISDSTAETLNEDDLYDISITIPTRVSSTFTYRTPQSKLSNKNSNEIFDLSSKQSSTLVSPQVRAGIHSNKMIDEFQLDNNEMQQQNLRIRKLKSIVQQKQSRNSQINCTNDSYYDQSTQKDNSRQKQSPNSVYDKIFNSSFAGNIKQNYNNQKIIYKSMQQKDEPQNFKQAIENLNYYQQNNTPISNASCKDNSVKQFNQRVSLTNNQNQNYKDNQREERKRSNTIRIKDVNQIHHAIRQKSYTETINRPRSVSINSMQSYQLNRTSKHKEINQMNQQNRRGKNTDIQNEINSENIQKIIFKQCFDQYDHYRIETINNDEQLDGNYLQEFIQLNHLFVEENASLHLHSIEKMYTNNCKISLESILKINIPEKSQQLLDSHVTKMNEAQNKINQKQNFKNRQYIQKHIEKKEIISQNYIRTPYDLVIIIDFNEQYRYTIFSALREIIFNQSTIRDRISLIFPSKYGKCVRTDLLTCSQSNQQLLMDTFEQIVSDVANCLEFSEISFKNAIWTLKERKYLNFQCALFWISEGQIQQFSGSIQKQEKLQSKPKQSESQKPPLFEMVQEILQQECTTFSEFNQSQNINKQLEKQQINKVNALKKLQIYTFQIGQKDTDQSLQQIANLKQGIYYFINKIEDLKIKISQAIKLLASNVGFDFSTTINLITHSQIKIKNQIETQSTLSQIPQIIIEDQNEYINFQDTHSNLKDKISSRPTQSEINKLQQQNYKLYESDISKMYGEQNLWSRIDSSQISVRIPIVRHKYERKFGFQITIKPSYKFSQCDIAEFEIANAVCIINTLPSYLYSNHDFDIVKKFTSCSTELHFLQNRTSSQNLPSLKNSTFNDISNTISCDLSYLPKNKDKKNEIYQTIFNQEFISHFEDIYNNLQTDEENNLRDAAQQLKNQTDSKLGYFKQTVKSNESSIYSEIEEFQKFISNFGFDERAKCYLKYLVQFYRHQ